MSVPLNLSSLLQIFLIHSHEQYVFTIIPHLMILPFKTFAIIQIIYTLRSRINSGGGGGLEISELEITFLLNKHFFLQMVYELRVGKFFENK